jgi:WD40 repeat protein
LSSRKEQVVQPALVGLWLCVAAGAGTAAGARDCFGDPLQDGALARLGTVRFRHGGQVTALALSPDGKTLASGNNSGTIRLWDPASSKEIGQLAAKNGVISLAFSPDAKFLAAGTWFGPVLLFDLASGRVLRELSNRHNTVNAVAFAPDGKLLAAGSSAADGVILWDVPGGKQVRELVAANRRGPYSHVVGQSLAFAPDGQTLAQACQNQIRLWNTATGEVRHLPDKHRGLIHCLAFAPREPWLASAGEDKEVCFWDWKAGKPAGSLQASAFGTTSLAFSPSGRTLAVAARFPQGEHVRLLDPSAKTVLRSITTNGLSTYVGSVQCLVFRSDHTLIGGDHLGQVRVWDLSAKPVARKERQPKGGDLVPSLAQDWGHDAPITTLAGAPDGKLAATGGSDGSVRVWDARTGKEVRRLAVGSDVHGLAWAPDGRLLGAVDHNGWVHLWQTGTWRRARVVKDFQASCLAFAPDCKTLALGGTGREPGSWPFGSALVVDVETFQPVRRFDRISHAVLSVAFSADGRVLATGASGERHNGPMPPGGLKFDANVIRTWDLAGGKELCQFGGPRLWVTGLAFSPDGRSLAAVGHEEFFSSEDPGVLSIWETATGQERARATGPKGAVSGVAFAADGKRLAFAGSFDPLIHLWDLNEARVVHSFRGHAGPVNGLTFAPDGRTLLSVSQDSTGLVWRLPPAAPEAASLADQQTQGLWEDLANGDAKVAFRTVLALKAAPRQALALLQTRLALPPRPSASQLADWIRDLDSPSFAARRRAAQSLLAAGDWAIPVLQKFLAGKNSLEANSRAQKLLQELQGPERWRVFRAFEVLVHIPEGRQLVETLARGPAELLSVREARATLRGWKR